MVSLIYAFLLLLSSGILYLLNYVNIFPSLKQIALNYTVFINIENALFIPATFLLLLSIITLIVRKRRPYTHVLTIYSIVLYFSVLILVNLFFKRSEPSVILSLLDPTKFMLVLIIVVLEFVLFFVLSFAIKMLNKSRARRKKEKIEIVEPNEVEELVVKAKQEFPKYTNVPSIFSESKNTEYKEEKVDKVDKVETVIEEVKKEIKIDLNEKHNFTSGSVLEASIESLSKEHIKVEPPKAPIKGYEDRNVRYTIKKEDEDFAPKGLSKDHPRYKMFASLKNVNVKTEEKIEQNKNEDFAPKGLSKDHPRYKMFEALQRPKAVDNEEVKDALIQDNELVEETPVETKSSYSMFIEKEEDFVPKGLSKDHPRYKMFEALQRPKAVDNEEIKDALTQNNELVEETPVETKSSHSMFIEKEETEDDFAPKGLSKEHPRYKMFESLKQVKKDVVVKDESHELPRSSSYYQEESTLKVINGGVLDDVKPEIKEKTEEGFRGVGGLKRYTNFTYNPPTDDLLDSYPSAAYNVEEEDRSLGYSIQELMNEFKVEVTLTNISKGPTITLFEYRLAPGLLISKVTSLTSNISLRTGGLQIRVLAPIPGKNAIGIEVPNKKRSIVGFKELLDPLRETNSLIPIILGKNTFGSPVIMDVAKAPHMLIAGTTGSGKSVCLNSLICSILYTRTPKQVKIIMVDPKVVELKVYDGIPHLLTPVITDLSKVMKILAWLVDEMERRFSLFGQVGARNIESFNSRIKSFGMASEKMPNIVLILDEFGDIKLQVGKDVENSINRLMAKSRAAGIHVIIATQRPSADVITGTIKNNIPTRIAFSVPANINSRIILDEGGAENLLGRGDMLYCATSSNNLERVQCSYLSDDEIEKVVAHVKTQGEPDYLDESIFEDEVDEDEDDGDQYYGAEDSIYEQAKQIVFAKNSASASFLQRKLSIGYNKAAKIIEQMEDEGIIGPANGSKPREILRYDR